MCQTAAMEVILDLTLFNLVMEVAAKGANIRVGIGGSAARGEELQPLETPTTHTIVRKYSFEYRFEFILGTRKKWRTEIPLLFL